MLLHHHSVTSLTRATLLAPSSPSFPQFFDLSSFCVQSLVFFLLLSVIQHALYVISCHSPICLELYRIYMKVEMHPHISGFNLWRTSKWLYVCVPSALRSCTQRRNFRFPSISKAPSHTLGWQLLWGIFRFTHTHKLNQTIFQNQYMNRQTHTHIQHTRAQKQIPIHTGPGPSVKIAVIHFYRIALEGKIA